LEQIWAVTGLEQKNKKKQAQVSFVTFGKISLKNMC